MNNNLITFTRYISYQISDNAALPYAAMLMALLPPLSLAVEHSNFHTYAYKASLLRRIQQDKQIILVIIRRGILSV